MDEQLKCTCGWPQGHAPTCPHGPNQGRIRQQAARITELEAQLAEKEKVQSAAIREAVKKSTTQIFKPSSGKLREITRLCKQWIHAANWPLYPNLQPTTVLLRKMMSQHCDERSLHDLMLTGVEDRCRAAEAQLAEAEEAIQQLVSCHGAAHQSDDLLRRRLRAALIGTERAAIKALLAGRAAIDTARKSDD